jgi:threonine/homoserine/homoserine lactone efflux protein
VDEIIQNILLGIALAAPIGPAGVAVIQSGLRWGFRRAFLTGLGITTADLTYMLVVYFGLSGFIQIEWVKIAIWSMGALVLFYLGVQSIRDGGRKIDFEGTSAATARNPFLVGYLVNISNPIAVVFWLGIFGSLIGSVESAGSGSEALLRGLSILIGILSWHTTMSALTNWGKRFVNDKTARVISIIAGVALIGFGLRFAYNALSALV